jgi:predicted nucleic acid-binding Zn ribbon protein
VIREFECEECGLVVERVAPAGKEPETPRCCGDRFMDRVQFSRASFSLKGDGWERDGYQKR